MSDTERIAVEEAVRKLVALADKLRRDGQGHMFIEYAPHVDWVDVMLYVPRWSESTKRAESASFYVDDDGTVDAAQLEQVITAIEAHIAGKAQEVSDE